MKTFQSEAAMQVENIDAYEALVQFLYRAPIGLVQTDLAGAVDMLNPMASSLLMPLATDAGLDNLFAVLDAVAPQVKGLADSFGEPSGVVCEALRVPLDQAHTAPGAPQVLSISLMKLDPQRLMAVSTDATLEMQREQETLRRRLRSAARTDALTRLPNRAAVREQLETVLKRPENGTVFALLFLNFDRFRQINDTLGQALGDQLLVTLADELLAAMAERGWGMLPGARRIDAAAGSSHLVARVGGDEFVVLLDGLRHLDEAERAALRLVDLLSRPHMVAGREVACRASVGVFWGAGADGAADADAVMRDASIAMVEAKRGGGARHVVFEAAMRERAARRADIEAQLRTALAEDQLFVVYQPVVGLNPDGSTDHAAGVEALVRWQHPVRGLVPPFDFIGVAEECGLIDQIGDFVLLRACTDFMRWQAELGANAPRLIAVNLSRAQLAQPDWTAKVSAILAQTGMAASSLQLEVTESLAAQDEQTQLRLHELKALGIKLALDDFGTGYSSLSSLHLLPVDTVKIDRSFVCKADTSHHHQVLIEATVKVASSLGMNTVAEGIETEAQALAVRAQHCAKGQGYFYSRPLPTDALVAWLRERTA
ncbi:bifunctional diguanylate cyclase/phosphodiesterase [Massilia sp. YIM B02769]|uniref:putative bifunctional diguanylate cyclase/phosphodiesterase n=1 Tax=Massilia sp. YIM B02769 TaxID=3050129 RepID=UPI0025B65A4C|nr:bifunctional diguanylate cyclase/phosphodiesterase [Massilia sp. YIM B02769]